ncbi:zinc finger protein Dzip1-like isoform X1 [Scleropages formosus]|uniref:zinc finger protein Dzip1-like isoform X1 n=1 Tax=Scleropages formosus TaxID=113540 RepID=UPI0010FA8E85|nr:zinc finger protein Dzip1-like isoform X1 [Scleropages formosus]XP_029113840.1 zinc finger protein Dzip1-like isoform X1 [Scleropages formosus]
MSETQSDVHSIKLEEEISKLKDQLMVITSKLDIQQQAYMVKVSQEQDQRSKEKELFKALEQWKDEEKERQKAQMEEMRHMMLKEFNKLSNMIDLLQDFLFYLNRLHSSAYIEEERNRKVDKLERELQEQKELILFQREQMKKFTSGPSEQGNKSTEKNVEAKNQKCALRRNHILKEMGLLLLQAYLMELEPICKGLVGTTEKKAKMNKETAKSTLRRSQNVKELQPLLEQALLDQLEAMVKADTSGLSKAKVGSGREKKHFPKFQRIREKLAQTLGLRLKGRTDLAPEQHMRSRWPFSETRVRSLPSNFASSVAHVVSRLGLSQSRTSSFSSEDDSEEESSMQRPRAVAISPRRPATLPADSDSEWIDGSNMEETSQQQVGLNKHSSQNREISQGELITDLMRNLERLFAECSAMKPEDGEDVLYSKNNVQQKREDSEKDDDDDDDDGDGDDDDDDDLDSCSLEDNPLLNKPAPLTKILDSMSTSI